MSLEEAAAILDVIETNLGETIPDQGVKDLEDQILNLLLMQNDVYGRLRSTLNPIQTRQSRGIVDDLYVYYSEGMILTFSDADLWVDWATDNGLSSGVDYEIVPEGLLVRSDPFTSGKTSTEGPKSFSLSWDYVQPIYEASTSYRTVKNPEEGFRFNNDWPLPGIPYVCFESDLNYYSPPQSWIDNTCVMRMAWYQNGKLIPSDYNAKGPEASMGPFPEDEQMGKPVPIRIMMTDSPTTLTLYGNYFNNEVVEGVFNFTSSIKGSLSSSVGLSDPTPFSLLGGYELVLIKILKNVKLRPRSSLSTSNEPFRKIEPNLQMDPKKSTGTS